MKIKEILSQKPVTISFEVFPPKTTDRYEEVSLVAEEIAHMRPDFMSVTYGAGGGTSDYTRSISKSLQDRTGVPILAHLTCVSSDKAHVRTMIEHYREDGIENIMALRGDIPPEGRICHDYQYASELVSDIRTLYPDACIGAACYPDGHVECPHKSEDILHLKEKVDAGVDFLTTQMFFDNNVLYNFLYRLREADIRIPVLAGIMPITNAKQIRRSIALSGTTLPERFRAILDHFGDDNDAMQQAGIIYATEQIIDLLANGVSHIHVYSMNKPAIASGILSSLSHILR